jgi:mannose-6-phosphate isomerase-like protein (cupin superfamily)
VHILTDHEDTAGRYDFIVSYVPLNVATCLHRHTTYSEHFYVLKGEFIAHIELGSVMLKPCDNF